MTQAAHQTVRLGKGRHDSPDRGACVMELASLLAGERFTDHPRSVCPVIAGFLRSYNDRLPDGEHDELYAYASLVVGSNGRRSVRLERARHVLTWADRPSARPRRRHRLLVRLQPWDLVLLPAVRAALRLDPQERRVAVRALLEELVAMGCDPPVAERSADPVPLPAAGDESATGAPVPGFVRWW
jgi:hypothetical protein